MARHDLVIYAAYAPANCPEHGAVKGNTVHKVYDSRIGKTYNFCSLCIDEKVVPMVTKDNYHVIDYRSAAKADDVRGKNRPPAADSTGETVHDFSEAGNPG